MGILIFHRGRNYALFVFAHARAKNARARAKCESDSTLTRQKDEFSTKIKVYTKI